MSDEKEKKDNKAIFEHYHHTKYALEQYLAWASKLRDEVDYFKCSKVEIYLSICVGYSLKSVLRELEKAGGDLFNLERELRLEITRIERETKKEAAK